MKTKREIEEGTKHLPHVASKFLVDIDGQRRHEWRVTATIETGIAAAPHEDKENARSEWSRIAMVMDRIGVGGPMGCGGDATARLPIFNSLGSGRKQATDGAAYTAALTDAISSLDIGSGRARVRPELCEYYENAPSGWMGLELHPDDCLGLTHLSMSDIPGSWQWVQATARLALWHLAIESGLVKTSPPQGAEYLDLDVGSETWATLLAACEEQAVIEEAQNLLDNAGFSVGIEPDDRGYDLHLEYITCNGAQLVRISGQLFAAGQGEIVSLSELRELTSA